jgi:hypothetical protein
MDQLKKIRKEQEEKFKEQIRVKEKREQERKKKHEVILYNDKC